MPFNILRRVPPERGIVKQLSTILYRESQIIILYLMSSKLQSSKCGFVRHYLRKLCNILVFIACQFCESADHCEQRC